MLTVNIVAIIIENLDGLLTQKMQLEITRNFGKPVFEYIQNVPLYHMSDSNFVADKERAINAVENDISFEDKRKAADGLISSISATSDYVKIEWKI